MACRIEFKTKTPSTLTVQTESQDLIAVKNYVIYITVHLRKNIDTAFYSEDI